MDEISSIVEHPSGERSQPVRTGAANFEHPSGVPCRARVAPRDSLSDWCLQSELDSPPRNPHRSALVLLPLTGDCPQSRLGLSVECGPAHGLSQRGALRHSYPCLNAPRLPHYGAKWNEPVLRASTQPEVSTRSAGADQRPEREREGTSAVFTRVRNRDDRAAGKRGPSAAVTSSIRA
jgi:hypothetical protein